jgi:hypothetical protein
MVTKNSAYFALITSSPRHVGEHSGAGTSLEVP